MAKSKRETRAEYTRRLHRVARLALSPNLFKKSIVAMKRRCRLLFEAKGGYFQEDAAAISGVEAVECRVSARSFFQGEASAMCEFCAMGRAMRVPREKKLQGCTRIRPGGKGPLGGGAMPPLECLRLRLDSPRTAPYGNVHSRDGFARRGSQILRKSTSGLQWPHNGLTMATQWPLVIYTVAVLLPYFSERFPCRKSFEE